MKRDRSDRYESAQHYQYESSKRPRISTNKSVQTRTLQRWTVPESHFNMPQVIRQEVRDFHQISIYVSEPTKVKLASSADG